MTLTKDDIRGFRIAMRMEIDSELEALLLQRFGEEPYPYAYSEQDLYEQVRKIVMLHNRGKSAD